MDLCGLAILNHLQMNVLFDRLGVNGEGEVAGFTETLLSLVFCRKFTHVLVTVTLYHSLI